ncbi:peroxiredoxin [Sorangium cellulosum]|uniref:thioredoxin-dependent peroxiredoxin n=3 Tax=Sorangium cellulosum TaxID=56 RepID=A0A150U286_SORCE|nr:peroxiredoxin [Sorangium cellulosum]AGP32739.1 alkyl hydroperoxide reductase [Sorangium cellulosum So0157-2]KYG11061.1 antioxidant protein [Sorangium cellulosum]
MLKVGELAPEIDKLATDGQRFVLSRQGGLCTVVFFFPKAFTPGCTVETRQFRDNHVELALAGASLVGISTDDHRTQCRFAESHDVPFPMIADDDRSVCRAYGVLWPLIGVARRVTYVIAPDLRVAAVFHHELQATKHRDDVLAFVDERFRAARPGPPS